MTSPAAHPTHRSDAMAHVTDSTPGLPSTPRKVKKRGIVWLGAALLAAVLQADL